MRENFADWARLPAQERINAVGHRVYTGGANEEMWYGIGKLQYHFLVSQGLRAEHTFLDIACGGLRLGQYLIPYLAENNYQGLDAEKDLIRRGLKQELFADLVNIKKPKFFVNKVFDFTNIKAPDFAMAQSLFTHLLPEDIALCFRNFSQTVHQNTKFFFTYFDGDSKRNPTDRSHSNLNFFYKYEELRDIIEPQGWTTTLIGDWNHPRRQQMIMGQLAK